MIGALGNKVIGTKVVGPLTGCWDTETGPPVGYVIRAGTAPILIKCDIDALFFALPLIIYR